MSASGVVSTGGINGIAKTDGSGLDAQQMIGRLELKRGRRLRNGAGAIGRKTVKRVDRKALNGLGPFVSFSLGQYSSYGFGDESEDMDETAMHQWLTIGARGSFSL